MHTVFKANGTTPKRLREELKPQPFRTPTKWPSKRMGTLRLLEDQNDFGRWEAAVVEPPQKHDWVRLRNSREGWRAGTMFSVSKRKRKVVEVRDLFGETLILSILELDRWIAKKEINEANCSLS